MNNYQDSSNNSRNTILTTFIRTDLGLNNGDAIYRLNARGQIEDLVRIKKYHL
jgi:hypothetical protein